MTTFVYLSEVPTLYEVKGFRKAFKNSPNIRSTVNLGKHTLIILETDEERFDRLSRDSAARTHGRHMQDKIMLKNPSKRSS